jgi:eukaryotic-like serine/threonine-protein kinase
MAHELSREWCNPMTGQRFVFQGDEYVLGSDLGDGAIRLVRKAIRTKDNALRAVKFLAPDPKYIDEGIFTDVAARFKREGERGANLRHPHLLTIYSHCVNSGGELFESREPRNPFLLMEQIQGRTLESYIRKRPEEERGKFAITREKLHIAIQIANALDELHRLRVVHRDIKPKNIFLSKISRGDLYPLAKLGDFGVVKWGDFHSSLSTGVLTATNQKGLGTMKYMSPEQAINPKTVTASSDIYSLGITLFELFSAQILASPHHVFEVMTARLARGTTASRFASMGYSLHEEDDRLAALLLDMFLRGTRGRPAIDVIKGYLESEYERRYEINWEDEIDWESDRRDYSSWESD